MVAIQQAWSWFYNEFGIKSVYHTGRNAYLIILARTCRMVAYGSSSLALGEFPFPFEKVSMVSIERNFDIS
jgi:hypothetical protein